MNRHLSSDQMSEWAMGSGSPELERHLHECAACRAEANRFGEALVGFRDSMHRWSEGQIGVERPRPANIGAPRAWASFRHLRWASVAVATLAMAGFWAVFNHGERGVTNSAAADAELLQQIDQAVSRSVPPSLKPLGDLVSWENASQAEPATPGRAQKE